MSGNVVRGAGPCLLLWLILLAPRPIFSAEGIFQGKVINPPADEPVRPGWIFVQGGNHLLRRVEVAHAVITFGQQVPPSQRRKCGLDCLEAGQEIRVTANQDSAGEWRATRVEILRLTAHGAGRWGGTNATGSGVPTGVDPLPIFLTKINTHSDRGCWITIAGIESIQPNTEKSL